MTATTYSEDLPVDNGSKEFLGVLANDSGNKFYAIKGGTVSTQNGEKVATLEMTSAQLLAALVLPAALSGSDGLKVTPTADVVVLTTQLPAALSGADGLKITPTGDIGVTTTQLPGALVDGQLLVTQAHPQAFSYSTGVDLIGVPGYFYGFLVTAVTGTASIKIYDTNPIIDTMIVNVGSGQVLPMGVAYTEFHLVVTGTLTVTVYLI